ncbi:hypothetical protein TNCV_3201401 [Trichonephila clavipes]|nr:hypothetical protein TNCV_3201401 [Trichonephila clavipes]
MGRKKLNLTEEECQEGILRKKEEMKLTKDGNFLKSCIHTKAVSVERLANHRLHLARGEVSDSLHDSNESVTLTTRQKRIP